MQILAFMTILIAAFVTDRGDAHDYHNGKPIKPHLSDHAFHTALGRHDNSITVKMDFASNQVIMISKAELFMTDEPEYLTNLEGYPIHPAG